MQTATSSLCSRAAAVAVPLSLAVAAVLQLLIKGESALVSVAVTTFGALYVGVRGDGRPVEE